MHTLPRAWKTLNTDFPNYYLAAHLAQERFDTSRMYEWPWVEREKDHRAIDVRVIGLLPITPFSTLAVWPLVGLSPLTAKHYWILINLALLVPIGWMLRAMTGLSYRRIALVITLSYPLHRNLLFGQFYIVLLLLLTAACWSYLRGLRILAGALIAVAAACKIFPLLLFVFFFQRRDWRALVSGAITSLVAVSISIAIFGLNAHRTWLQEIFPWVMRGEGLGTYGGSSSISGVLHGLLLSEPQWNPHPWHYSPFWYSLLAPGLQMLALAPAILLIRRDDRSKERVLLEWSALVIAALTISTIPASYNFVLMVFPICVLASTLLARRQYWWLSALIVAYLGIGFSIASPPNVEGLRVLLYVPRLPLMLAILLGIYVLLWRDCRKDSTRDWTRYAWAVAMVTAVALSMRSTLYTERAEREEYAYRIPLQMQGFANSGPQLTASGVRFSAFTMAGYRLITQAQDRVHQEPDVDASYDLLSFASGAGHTWAERASSTGSQIVDLQQPSQTLIENAREPMLSADQQSLAFIRDEYGRGRLMLRKNVLSNAASETELTPLEMNVYEASLLSEKHYAFSATDGDGLPQIYLTDVTHNNSSISIPGTRYPALSPDERWMAYSQLDHGVWNLWLRNQVDGTTRRIADVPCNQIQPFWESDSKTLLYDTDCGRSIWLTAVSRRKVVP
ncbi:glycosyltransferase family 87 protein [Terracidiphilus gabretensis]|uniref:glycosyltransferase family 87 protein n=1 Tax=Terracidiphilus gabretensis TaxID=1577687 RepID=UPI0009EAFBC2|nr:glycosyltransferase family 87 protein [Terracidiphilus gabretensis]